jgi:hypothetical protein
MRLCKPKTTGNTLLTIVLKNKKRWWLGCFRKLQFSGAFNIKIDAYIKIHCVQKRCSIARFGRVTLVLNEV